MNKLQLQQISDTILLDNVMIILAGLNRDLVDNCIVKEANLVDSFKDIGENIKKAVQQKVHEKGKFHALTEILSAGALLSFMGPYGQALSFAAQLFGIPIQGLIESAVSAVLPKLEKGEKIAPEDIQVEASVNYLNIKLSILNDASNNNKLFSLLREGQSDLPDVIKNAASSRSVTSRLARKFSDKSPASKSLFVKIILWFVKTAFMGAGLMYVSPAVFKEVKEVAGPLLGGEKSPEKDKQEREDVSLPPVKHHNLKASGKGEQFHQNNDSSMWVVPIVNGDIKQTLLGWAKEIYPEVLGKDNIILSSISFNKIASILDGLIDPSSPNSLIVPEGIHTRRDIVDVFIGDVAEKLKETNAA